MTTIRRRGGLFVATAAVCLVLLSTPAFVQAEANALRGRSLISQNTDYAKLNTRRLEGGEGQGGEGQQGEKNNQEGEQKQEQQQQQYGEGNNNEQEEQHEEEAEQQQEGEEQQQEEEPEEENDVADANYEQYDMNDDAAAADDDQSNFATNVQNTVSTTVSDAQDTLSDLMERFDEDVANMWSSSPSEWNDEMWKVFGVTAGVFTLLLSCIFYICCLCCKEDDGRDGDASSKGRWRKKNHRGRLFNRMQDNDTVATEQDPEKPFILIQDVESTAAADAPNAIYANKNENIADAISPMSSKTGRTGFTTRGPMEDDKTAFTKSSFKTRKSQKQGVFAETVDVWSEFLGFKKAQSYSTAAFMKRHIPQEDTDIDETDDEISRRAKRRSSSRNSRNSRNSKYSSNSRQMKTGTYVAPKHEEMEGGKSDGIMAPTPLMSNVVAQVADKNNGKSALSKTRNLLKNIGKSKSTDSKSLGTKNSKESSNA